MNNLFGPVNPLTPERVARLCELAWWDGMRSGCCVGLLVGVVLGIIVARLLREERGSGTN